MSVCRNLFINFILYTIACALDQDIYIVNSNYLQGSDIELRKINYYLDVKDFLQEIDQKEKVSIQLYYECLCPDCIQFDTKSLAPVVQRLSTYLNIETYPYGNAKTFPRNGGFVFKCQHGPEECYGNKLHACAIDVLQNMTQAVLYNSCMMKPRHGKRGSNDDAADACGIEQNIDAAPIKECAKGEKGIQLLKYYGDESKKANFNYVPYILINGKLNDGDNFMNDVCAAFTNPPAPCRKYIKNQDRYRIRDPNERFNQRPVNSMHFFSYNIEVEHGMKAE